jgi:hypothetical protein
MLEAFGPVAPLGSDALLVEAGAGRGSELSRALAQAGLYPAELGMRRQTLEHVFIELTGERDVAAPEAAVDAAAAEAVPS